MASILYNRGLDELRDWESDVFKAMLVTSSYTPNKDHDYVSSVSGNELSTIGSNYARATLGSKTRTITDATDRIVYDCANPSFGAIVAGQYARYMVVYREVTNDADSILIACIDLGSSIATSGTIFSVDVDSAGLIYSNQGA